MDEVEEMNTERESEAQGMNKRGAFTCCGFSRLSSRLYGYLRSSVSLTRALCVC